MTVERRPPAAPFIPVPEDFSDAWNKTDLALGRIGQGLGLIDAMLAGSLTHIPVEDQNQLGFLVDSLVMHVQLAEKHLKEVSEAVRIMARAES